MNENKTEDIIEILKIYKKFPNLSEVDRRHFESYVEAVSALVVAYDSQVEISKHSLDLFQKSTNSAMKLSLMVQISSYTHIFLLKIDTLSNEKLDLINPENMKFLNRFFKDIGKDTSIK